jgi:lipoprotein-anchoring transpeptidase ErfK/SrfK
MRFVVTVLAALAVAPPASAFVHEPSSPGARPSPPPAPAYEILRVRSGQLVALRARKILATLEARTEFGSPQTLAVVARRGPWARVVTSARANGRHAWVEVDAKVAVRRTRVTVTLDLSARKLVVRQGDAVLRRMTVGIGRPTSPTPTGRFAVTDKLAGGRYGPYYGCCIVALSAHQPNLPAGWTGGDRIAVHGTNNPASIGAASSAGCPHAGEADMRVLMSAAPLGAPVFVRS